MKTVKGKGLGKFFTSVKENIARVMFPRHLTCLLCDAELFDFAQYNICKGCYALLEHNTNFCEVCGRAISEQRIRCAECIMDGKAFVKARSAVIYEGLAKVMILKLKFGGSALFTLPMAKLMSEAYIANGFNCDIITFVPTTSKTLATRGYNQAELISKKLSVQINLPLLPLLKKVKETKGQEEVEYSERNANISNAYEVADMTEGRDKTVLLVDDVYTSGSTADECAKRLVAKGAKAVYVLTFASVKAHILKK